MSFSPLYAAPGVCKVNSPYASGKPVGYTQGRVAQGRYVDGNHIRFVAGFPEKLGGWVASTATGIVGIPRAMRTWLDNSNNPRLAIGTENHLYYYDGTDTVDITPLRTISTGTLSSALSTTNGSATVAVADTSQKLVDDDFVYLSAGSAVGGLTILGWYKVSGRTSSGYDITAASKATSTAASGGGTTTFNYPRVTLTGPFATTSGSADVTVTHTAHGATTNDYVTFSGASAVGGLTIDGEYEMTVIDTDTYTVTADAEATSTATGGGSVSVIYAITISGSSVTKTASVYGGTYGPGPYGYVLTASNLSFTGWTLSPYGNQLIAAPVNGTIYVYDPVQAGRAYQLLNAPIGIRAMLVTPERFVVALGNDTNPMQIAWADQTDYTNWTSGVTNTANSGRTLHGGGYFVGGVAVRDGVSLILTNRYAFQMSYSGDNFIYDTPAIADNAGLISPFAIVAQGEAAYWMSDAEFWVWNGTVQALPSDDIRDYVFGRINRLSQGKCCAGLNRVKREVWFFYPSSSATEIDSYVIFHIDQACWSIGTMERTAWIDADLFSNPFGSDASGVIYQHEVGTDDAGSAMDSLVTYAPVDVSNGTANVDIFGFIPDFERLSGSLTLSVNTKYYPFDTNTVSGPYTIETSSGTQNSYIDLRVDGKMVGYTIESNSIGADFRLGLPRVDAQPAGARI